MCENDSHTMYAKATCFITSATYEMSDTASSDVEIFKTTENLYGYTHRHINNTQFHIKIVGIINKNSRTLVSRKQEFSM
jgi:hypothetical protein